MGRVLENIPCCGKGCGSCATGMFSNSQKGGGGEETDTPVATRTGVTVHAKKCLPKEAKRLPRNGCGRSATHATSPHLRMYTPLVVVWGGQVKAGCAGSRCGVKVGGQVGGGGEVRKTVHGGGRGKGARTPCAVSSQPQASGCER